MKLILASASPRRRELLTQVGVSFVIEVSDVEELNLMRFEYAIVERTNLIIDIGGQRSSCGLHPQHINHLEQSCSERHRVLLVVVHQLNFDFLVFHIFDSVALKLSKNMYICKC